MRAAGGYPIYHHEVFRQEWGERPNSPTISVLYVAGLANPDFLAEIDAVAVVPA